MISHTDDRRDDLEYASGGLNILAEKYQNSAKPIPVQEVPESAKKYASLFMQNQELLDRYGWIDVSNSMGDESGHYGAFINPETKEGVLAFRPYDPESYPYIPDNVDTDVFVNIPTNRVETIRNGPFFSDSVSDGIKRNIDLMKQDGYDLKFAGYSYGGYLAKHWGSLNDVPQEVFNAHIFPANTFPETTASTTFHTIATDITNFKYVLPGDPDMAARDTHYIYPGESGIDSRNHTIGLFDSHPSSNDVSAMFRKPSPQSIAKGLNNINNGLIVAQATYDIATGEYEKAAELGTATAIINKTGGYGAAPIQALGYTEMAIEDVKEGRPVKSAVDTTSAGLSFGIPTGTVISELEAGAGLTAALGAGGQTSFVVGDVLGAGYSGYEAYESAQEGRTGDAVAHSFASAAYGLGALLTPVTGGASAVVGGVLGTLIEIGDSIADSVIEKKKAHEALLERQRFEDFEKIIIDWRKKLAYEEEEKRKKEAYRQQVDTETQKVNDLRKRKALEKAEDLNKKLKAKRQSTPPSKTPVAVQ